MTAKKLRKRIGPKPRRKVKRPRLPYEKLFRAAAARNYVNIGQERNKYRALYGAGAWPVKWMTAEELKKAFPDREPVQINLINGYRPDMIFIDELRYPESVTQISKLRQSSHTETHTEMLRHKINGIKTNIDSLFIHAVSDPFGRDA